MKNFIKEFKENFIENVLALIFIILILFLIYLLCLGAYRFFTTKDEVQCLGGHYVWRYNHTTKTNMRYFVCDSAKIIYK
jgi:hypothetical protein